MTAGPGNSSRQSGCQNLYTGRGLQNCGGNPRGEITLQEVQGQVFSHLLTCLPMPMPAPALDTVISTEGRSSLTDLTGPTSILFTNWHQKGLACPYSSPNCQEEKAQLKAGVRLVAAVAGGFLKLGEAHQLGPSLPSADTYNLVIP